MAHARFGSISHCGQRALAVIADRPVGVDIERRFTPQLAAELESSIISPAETALRSGLPYPLALTLAFSAKRVGLRPAIPTYRRASVLTILRWLQ